MINISLLGIKRFRWKDSSVVKRTTSSIVSIYQTLTGCMLKMLALGPTPKLRMLIFTPAEPLLGSVTVKYFSVGYTLIPPLSHSPSSSHFHTLYTLIPPLSHSTSSSHFYTLYIYISLSVFISFLYIQGLCQTQMDLMVDKLLSLRPHLILQIPPLLKPPSIFLPMPGWLLLTSVGL